MRGALYAFAVIVALVMLCGCSEAENRATAQSRALSQSTYSRDGRTNLCFSTTYINVAGNYQFSHASVPCTPEVLAMIRKPDQ